MTRYLHLPSTPREQLPRVHRDVWFRPGALALGNLRLESCSEFQASLSNRVSP